MKNFTNLEKWVLSEMAEHIRYWEGEEREVCLGDLAFELFDNENATGSYDCSSYRATQWATEYFDDLWEVVEDMKNEWGDVASIFGEPESFQVQVVLFLANRLMWESSTLQEADGAETEITLTDSLVERIAHDWETVAN